MVSNDVQDYIQPLFVNGMRGRALRVPAAKSGQREILLLYGHHALIERWWGLVQNLSAFGTVTMPDLPGLGGMDSFYSIQRKPTLDAYADYLAAFVKMQYRNRRLTIIGISFGFIVATRMLQRYPELAKKVDLVVSIVGFMHYDDFVYSSSRLRFLAATARVLSLPPVSFAFRYIGLNHFVIKNIYTRTASGKRRFKEVGAERFEELVRFETRLWQENDVRTHWYTTSQFLAVDNCTKEINLPLFHVTSTDDQYFDSSVVEQHMRVVYDDVTVATMKSTSHTPSILGTKAELSVMLPASLKKLLKRP
jgi:pimeloyl-ACP methyl ester carboxylesterase